MSAVNPSTDKEYEARWDAETLAGAESIKADPARLTAAQAAAKAIADERAENAKSMRKVASKKPPPDNSPAPKAGRVGPNNAPPKKAGGYNVFQKI